MDKPAGKQADDMDALFKLPLSDHRRAQWISAPDWSEMGKLTTRISWRQSQSLRYQCRYSINSTWEWGFHSSIQTPRHPTSVITKTRAIACDDATLLLEEPNDGATVEQNGAEAPQTGPKTAC